MKIIYANTRLKEDTSHPWTIECETNFPGIWVDICQVEYKPLAELLAMAPKMATTILDLDSSIHLIPEDLKGDLEELNECTCRAQPIVKAIKELEPTA